jgi:hypothetical protein
MYKDLYNLYKFELVPIPADLNSYVFSDIKIIVYTVLDYGTQLYFLGFFMVDSSLQISFLEYRLSEGLVLYKI